jgi:hypothetical protein
MRARRRAHYIRKMGRGGNGERDLPTNARRAGWAEAALSTYTDLTLGGRGYLELVAEDRKTALVDLITDLMHLARRDGTDFAVALELAREHAATESRVGWHQPTP